MMLGQGKKVLEVIKVRARVPRTDLAGPTLHEWHLALTLGDGPRRNSVNGA